VTHATPCSDEPFWLLSTALRRAGGMVPTQTTWPPAPPSQSPRRSGAPDAAPAKAAAPATTTGPRRKSASLPEGIAHRSRRVKPSGPPIGIPLWGIDRRGPRLDDQAESHCGPRSLRPELTLPYVASAWAFVGALATACVLAGHASAGPAMCGQESYSYAGIGTRTITSGVNATITATGPSAVRDGHVAGWVGVGGEGEGPRGTDAWIQIGLSTFLGEKSARIYYEFTRPDGAPVYRDLRRGIRPGERHQFAVVEVPWRPGWWRVWLDGTPASAPVFMPGSHRRWTAQFLGESWSGATTGSCNLFTYAFDHVSVAGAGRREWGPARRVDVFEDEYYRLVRVSPSSVLAQSI
jgi:hypothetical protein